MAVVLLDAADHGHVALLPQLRLEADLLLLVMVVVAVTDLRGQEITKSQKVEKNTKRLRMNNTKIKPI